MVKLKFFIKKMGENLDISKKLSTFAPQFRKLMSKRTILGYGVMVTLQILVLSFLVRVRVSQQCSAVKSGF